MKILKKKMSAILMLLIILCLIVIQNINNIPTTINISNEALKTNYVDNVIYKISKEDIHVLSSGSKVKAKVKLFGLIPVKEVQINLDNDRKVLVGGQSIGVKLYTEGILVVGFSDIETDNGKKQSPAILSGIQLGDMIIEINNIKVKTIKDLANSVINSQGNSINLKVKRKDKIVSIDVKPVVNKNKQYKLGIWVRDSTSGIGTLTFVDPKLKKFAALGHPINDIDTGELMIIREGNIYKSQIIDIDKGERGKPGELKGAFSEENVLGNLKKNTICGIFGNIKNLNDFGFKDKTLYPVAYQNEIKEGEAKILVEVDEQVKEYKIVIEKVNKQSSPNAKSMVIRITDKALLDKTGGIVQGMSGSPIIQDGKLIGAVTHVFINRPDMGYAIFAEWMYNELNEGF